MTTRQQFKSENDNVREIIMSDTNLVNKATEFLNKQSWEYCINALCNAHYDLKRLYHNKNLTDEERAVYKNAVIVYSLTKERIWGKLKPKQKPFRIIKNGCEHRQLGLINVSK